MIIKFNSFLERHRNQKSIIPESVEVLRGSYVMIDPAGRVFDNIGDGYKYSEPILEFGVSKTYSQMNYSAKLFDERGGFYDWKSNLI